jgi:hypothetical protein
MKKKKNNCGNAIVADGKEKILLLKINKKITTMTIITTNEQKKNYYK